MDNEKMGYRENVTLLISYHCQSYSDFAKLPHPRDVPLPSGCVAYTWVPQTMGDCIWKIVEFDSEDSKAEFIKGVKESIHSEAYIRHMGQDEIDHWCKNSE